MLRSVKTKLPPLLWLAEWKYPAPLAENPRKSKKLAGLKPQHPSLFGCTDTGETGDTGAQCPKGGGLKFFSRLGWKSTCFQSVWVLWPLCHFEPKDLFNSGAQKWPKMAQNDQKPVRLLWSAETAGSAWFLGGTSLMTSHPGYMDQFWDLCQPQFWPTGVQKWPKMTKNRFDCSGRPKRLVQLDSWVAQV